MSRTAAPAKAFGKSVLFETADNLLQSIGTYRKELAIIENKAQRDLAAITAEYEKAITPLSEKITELEKSLRALARKNKNTFFDGRDKADLTYGVLIYELKIRVKRARGILANLKTQGITEAIKIAESVDWDQLDKWPDDKLTLIGAERVSEENYEYELKDNPKT